MSLDGEMKEVPLVDLLAVVVSLTLPPEVEAPFALIRGQQG